MPEHRSDPALIQACIEGDVSAWNEMVDRYSRLVYSVPRRYGLAEADSDDVHQNVFRILAEKLETLRDQTRLSAWIITTTHRECWRLRRQAKLTFSYQDRELAGDEPPADLTERWERQHLVRRGLEELGDPCRSLLETLFHNPAEASYETIARDLGMKVGSIGPTRARCLQKLETILKRLGLEGWES